MSDATLRAFHGDAAIKAKYLKRVRDHRAADELIKGVAWDDRKGCAVGCTLDAYDHSRYPIELGIPEILAHLEDAIFEGLPNDRAQAWPAQFLRAIKPGADLSRVGWKFLHWLITQREFGEFHHPSVRDAVAQCAEVLIAPVEGLPVDKSAAWSAAWSAARAAEAAAWSAAWSAARAAAWSAARAAEAAAWSAAWSAAEAARSAAWSAAEAARSAAYQLMAAQLLALLREAA